MHAPDTTGICVEDNKNLRRIARHRTPLLHCETADPTRRDAHKSLPEGAAIPGTTGRKAARPTAHVANSRPAS